jgi:hypothetical protein
MGFPTDRIVESRERERILRNWPHVRDVPELCEGLQRSHATLAARLFAGKSTASEREPSACWEESLRTQG